LGADDASNRMTREEPRKDVEADVPPGSTHRDEAATDVGPQGEARAANNGFEFPPHLKVTPVVLERLGRVGSRHCCVSYAKCGRSHRGELHLGSSRAQAPIGVERSPLAELRRVSKRTPDFFRRMAQLSDENERPLFAILSYLRPAGRTRFVLLAIDHLLLLTPA